MNVNVQPNASKLMLVYFDIVYSNELTCHKKKEKKKQEKETCKDLFGFPVLPLKMNQHRTLRVWLKLPKPF